MSGWGGEFGGGVMVGRMLQTPHFGRYMLISELNTLPSPLPWTIHFLETTCPIIADIEYKTSDHVVN